MWRGWSWVSTSERFFLNESSKKTQFFCWCDASRKKWKLTKLNIYAGESKRNAEVKAYFCITISLLLWGVEGGNIISFFSNHACKLVSAFTKTANSLSNWVRYNVKLLCRSGAFHFQAFLIFTIFFPLWSHINLQKSPQGVAGAARREIISNLRLFYWSD